MIDYSVEILIFDNGERYPILMGSDEMPHFYVTLWVTSTLRSVGRAVSTISNKLEHIKWFLGWQAQEQRDLYKEFQQRVFPNSDDIQNIKSYLAISSSKCCPAITPSFI